MIVPLAIIVLLIVAWGAFFGEIPEEEKGIVYGGIGAIGLMTVLCFVTLYYLLQKFAYEKFGTLFLTVMVIITGWARVHSASTVIPLIFVLFSNGSGVSFAFESTVLSGTIVPLATEIIWISRSLKLRGVNKLVETALLLKTLKERE